MLCPHCSSPHHNLCAGGFSVEVDMTTLPQALSDFSASSFVQSKSHLLGSTTTKPITDKDAKPSILVVLPVFSDTGLGAYGHALLAARAPELIKDGELSIADFQGASAQTHLIDLPASPSVEVQTSDGHTSEPAVHVLLVGLGNRSTVETKGMCALVGSALDGAVSGLHKHIVIAVSDFNSAPNSGQQIAALTRCRLTVALVEEQAALVLSRLTLIVESDQVPAICRGVDIAGPLCSSCSHPRTAIINLPHSRSQQ